MWVVLLILTLLFSYLAEKQYNKNIILCKIFLFFIIVTHVVIIGLRDIGVGVDTMLYIVEYYNYAASISDVGDLLVSDRFDKGFVVLALAAYLFGDSMYLMLFSELFIIVFTILGLYEYKKTMPCNFFFFFLCFSFVYLMHTFNIMRQFCAISILFWGFAMFLQKKYAIYVCAQILAYFFHSSSILFIIVPLTFLFSKADYIKKYTFAAGTIIFFVIFLLFYHYFMSSLQNYGVLKNDYFDVYGKGSSYTSTQGYSLRAVLYLIFELLIAHVLYKKKEIDSSIIYIICVLGCLNCVLVQMLTVMTYFFRLSYYVDLILVVYMSSLLKVRDKQVLALLLCYLFLGIQGSFFFYDKHTLADNYLVYKSSILLDR